MLSALGKLLNPAKRLPAHFRGQPWSNVSFLIIDLELTSLDVARSEIVSIGWVEACQACIVLDSCYYKVINTDRSLEQSPVIHGLTEQDVRKGEALHVILAGLGARAQSHVWVFHNSRLDMGVLSKAFKRDEQDLASICVLDTLQLAGYLLTKQLGVIPNGALTLSQCVRRLGLPSAPEHAALEDAMSTAQLMLALFYELDPQGQSTLDDLLHTGALQVFKSG